MKQHYKQNDNSRLYNTPYGQLPSVTTILDLYDGGKSGALMGWANKMMAQYLMSLANNKGHIVITKEEVQDIFKKAKAYHKQVKQEAADLGSQAHNLIEVYLKGQPVDGLLEENPKLQAPFAAFRLWQANNRFEFIATERQICSKLGFAGTLDAIAQRNGSTYLVDFKTSTAIRETYPWQIAAYRMAVEDGMCFDNEKQGWTESKIRINGMGILRMDKETGEPEWKEYSEEEFTQGQRCFCALLHIWQTTKPKKEG